MWGRGQSTGCVIIRTLIHTVQLCGLDSLPELSGVGALVGKMGLIRVPDSWDSE